MRTLILISLFFITLGATPALAAEDPKWETLNALFGLDIESEKVKQMVRTYDWSAISTSQVDSKEKNPSN